MNCGILVRELRECENNILGAVDHCVLWIKGEQVYNFKTNKFYREFIEEDKNKEKYDKYEQTFFNTYGICPRKNKKQFEEIKQRMKQDMQVARAFHLTSIWKSGGV